MGKHTPHGLELENFYNHTGFARMNISHFLFSMQAYERFEWKIKII